jgi:BirA family biotin operon repressor/biotin-[acetyl-CoA-carboxylase] ligase
LNVVRLSNELRSEGFFAQWLYQESVSSTLDLARGMAEKGAPEGTVVIAGRQTAGRGRLGRFWESPPGGAWFSLLLRSLRDLGQAGCISVLSAVAIAQALRERYELPVLVKWPNDLFLYGKKLGGILVELSSVGARIDWLILGVGINVNNPLPQGTRVAPISLAVALSRCVALEDFYRVTLKALARSYLMFLREGFEPIRQCWKELSLLEDGVWVRKGQERFLARVRGLSQLGKLVVEREGRIEELVAEEVTLGLKE